MISAALAGLLGAPSKPLNLDALEQKLDAICEAFQGKIGYAVRIPSTGQLIEHNGEVRFRSASTIKTALLIEAVNQVEEGKRAWTDQKEIPPKAERTANMASQWAYFLQDGLKINLDGWCNLMITYSDNTATKVVGMWLGNQAVKDRMESFGLSKTAFLAYPPADAVTFRRWNRSFGMGMTTPSEMSRLWELIYQGKAAKTEAGNDRILRILKRQYWDDFLAATVPADVQVACKSGALDASRSDTGIVWGATPYVVAIYTDEQKDRRWTMDNEGDRTIRTMGSLIWNALNPKRPYQPPKDFERFAPTGGGVE